MPRLLSIILLVLAAPAAAQGLTITPSSFDASAADPLVFRNGTAAPIRFDSLRFARSVPYSPVGWFIRWTAGTTDAPADGYVYCEIAYRRTTASSPACFDAFGLFGRMVQPGERIVFQELRLTCGACRSAGGIGDTMHVYTDGSAVSQAVPVLNGGFVAAEAGPGEPGPRLSVSPNPAGRIARLDLAGAASVRIVAFDRLGREVAVLHDGPTGGPVDIDVSAWPPGVYVLLATTAGQASSSHLVVVR